MTASDGSLLPRPPTLTSCVSASPSPRADCARCRARCHAPHHHQGPGRDTEWVSATHHQFTHARQRLAVHSCFRACLYILAGAMQCCSRYLCLCSGESMNLKIVWQLFGRYCDNAHLLTALAGSLITAVTSQPFQEQDSVECVEVVHIFIYVP